MVTEPLRTPLLEAADRQGATTLGGLGMLVQQAAVAVELWTGADAPVEAMRRAAERSLG